MYIKSSLATKCQTTFTNQPRSTLYDTEFNTEAQERVTEKVSSKVSGSLWPGHYVIYDTRS